MQEFPINIPSELKTPSEAFVRASESVGLFWWYWEKSDGKIHMSPGLMKILGVAPESFNGLPHELYVNIHPQDVERNKDRVDRLYTGKDDLYEVEYRIRNPEGEWKWYYNRGSVLQKNEGGKPLVIGGITMDISGPFTELLAMVEEKEKFEFIFRHSTQAHLVLEVHEGRVVKIREANQAALELFQGEGEDILSMGPEQLSSEDMLATTALMIEQIKEKGFARFERKVRVRKSVERWIEFTAHGFSLTGEDLIVAIATDRTSRKKTEDALRETEELYRTLFEAANDRIGLYTVDGEALLLNSAFYESVGYTREEFLALDQRAMIHPEDRERLDLEGKELYEKGYSAHEYRVLHKNGTYLHMSSKIVFVHREEDEKDLILFIMRDITERKQSIKELEKAKEKAVESDKLKSAFLANMSHEIRTPMNSIIGFSNLLNKSDLENEERELYVSRIVSNSELLLTLITDIIDLAKIESGQVTMNYGRLLISELFAEMKQHASDEARRLQKENLEIHTRVEVEECVVEADALRITQVLKNLINNAIKFTAEGSVEIGCTLDGPGQTVVLYVKDTGIGIAPEHFDVIFDQFRQVDGSNTRKFGGTGLGLAICHNLVKLMEGRIWVESVPGKGSIFQVELPLKSPSLKKQDEPPVDKVFATDESKLEMSILAVDDEPHTLELYQALLNSLGHSVRTAENGYEALRLLEQFPAPDLILMDVQMPVLSGTDILKIIRERHPDVQVVAQSAHALVGDKERFMKEGYDEYLPKPFTSIQLEKVISNLKGK